MKARYVATKRLHVGDGVYIEPGDTIPLADTWQTFRAHVRLGWIQVFSDDESGPIEEPLVEKPQVKRGKGRPKKGG